MKLKFSLFPVMENIIEPTIDFDFSKLFLSTPSSLTGGAYFTRLFLNNKPLYIQTSKCLTKQGFIKSGKKIYTDLMFDNNDTIFIQWLENLETKCQELIYDKAEQWFETKLDKMDIESAFTSPIKIFKSGKYYLLRVNVKPNIKIYNESDEIIPLDNIQMEHHIISIIEIQGIRFTSRNFQIEIELKQSMVVSPDPFLEECFIKKPSTRKEYHLTNTEIQVKPLNVGNMYPNSNPNYRKEEMELTTSIVSNTSTSNEANELPSNINIDLEEPPYLEEEIDSNELKEFNLNVEDNLETITLKKPNQVYYEIYKAALEKAKQSKKEAIIAFLEAKNIKKTYMLEDIGDSDNDSEMNEDWDNISEDELEKEYSL